MDQAVDRGHGHRAVAEQAVPGAERLVRGYQQAVALVAVGDEFEQHRGFLGIGPDVADIVDYQQRVFVEFGQGLRQLQFLLGELKRCTERSRSAAAPDGSRRRTGRAGLVAPGRGRCLS